MGHYPSKEDADRMCQQLHDDGYSLARPVEVQEREQASAAVAASPSQESPLSLRHESTTAPETLRSAEPTTASRSSGEHWRIRAMSKLPSREAAESLKEQFEKDNFAPADVEQQGKTYTVVVGDFPSERAAQKALTELKAAGGYQPEGVQRSEPRAATADGSAGSSGSHTIWRVLVDSFDKSDDAEKSKEEMLMEDGYGDVEVQTHGDRFRLLMGHFPSKEDAERLCQQLHDDGYAYAKIVEVLQSE